MTNFQYTTEKVRRKTNFIIKIKMNCKLENMDLTDIRNIKKQSKGKTDKYFEVNEKRLKSKMGIRMLGISYQTCLSGAS